MNGLPVAGLPLGLLIDAAISRTERLSSESPDDEVSF